MDFGLVLPSFGHLARVDAITAVARAAEDLGYSSLWAAERLLVPVPPNQSWSRRDPTAFEPLVALSYVAALTKRIRLGTSVIILPVRNPVLLARAAASLDVLSGGRLELGVGIGWMREEMEASKVPFGERGRIADEHIEVLRSVWQGRGHRGKFTQVPPMLFEPRPIRGTIPIWVGGNSDAALNRVARLGDGWIPMGSFEPEVLKLKVDQITEMAKGVGRKSRIGISCNHQFTERSLKDPQGCIHVVESYQTAGATQLLPRFECESTSSMLEMLTTFAQHVIPSFA